MKTTIIIETTIIILLCIIGGFYLHIFNKTETNTDRKESYRECAGNLQTKEDKLNTCVEANQGQSVKERVKSSKIQAR